MIANDSRRFSPSAACLVSFAAHAQAEPSALALATDAVEGQSYSLSIQILVMMTLLTLAACSDPVFNRFHQDNYRSFHSATGAGYCPNTAEPGTSRGRAFSHLFRDVAGHRQCLAELREAIHE